MQTLSKVVAPSALNSILAQHISLMTNYSVEHAVLQLLSVVHGVPLSRGFESCAPTSSLPSQGDARASFFMLRRENAANTFIYILNLLDKSN